MWRPGPDATYADGDDASWMGVDWGAKQRFMTLLGRPINVLDTGEPAGEPSGPPLLFVHGWSANWQSWLLTIPAFMGSRRCVALDLPGFGFSTMPADPISIQGYARVVDALCAELGIGTVVAIGNSMGGFVCAELALAFPTRVERIVLVSAAGLSIERQPRRPTVAVARLLAAGYPLAEPFESLVVRRARLRRTAMALIVRYPEKLSAPLAHELVQASGKPGFLPALDALMSYSYRDRLPEIEVPVLIVWGRNDAVVPVRDAEDYGQLIGPNARTVVFDDTGHAPMIERPSRFNALLDEFLEGAAAPERDVPGVSA